MNRIVVKTKKDMDDISDYVLKSIRNAASGWDPKETLRIPFEKGEFSLDEELVNAKFECVNSDTVSFEVFVGEEMQYFGKFNLDISDRDGLDILDFDSEADTSRYDESTDPKYSNKELFYGEIAQKWLTVMVLATHYRPEFERNRKVTEAKKTVRRTKKGKKQVKTIYTKQYVLSGDFTMTLPKIQRPHSKPSHEYSVKGHYRRYKSGKVVWIKPRINCKGRGGDTGSTYIAKIK